MSFETLASRITASAVASAWKASLPVLKDIPGGSPSLLAGSFGWLAVAFSRAGDLNVERAALTEWVDNLTAEA